MTPDLRILGECDTDAFWTLRLEGLEQEPRSFGQSAEEHLALPKEAFAARLRSSSASRDFVLGAFSGPHLIGTAGFYRQPNQKEFHRGHIWGVYVTSAHRGRGVGRRLMAELLRIACAQPGLELINLGVASHNTPAKRLYESLGFEQCGRDVHALKIGDTYEDEDLMVLHLS
jgi:ribosomal protein S18 acetylase RimI-like enzyme